VQEGFLIVWGLQLSVVSEHFLFVGREDWM